MSKTTKADLEAKIFWLEKDLSKAEALLIKEREQVKQSFAELQFEKTQLIEKIEQLAKSKDELIDKWRRSYNDEAIKVQYLERKMNTLNQNHIVDRLAQIKMSKMLLHYNGDNDCTHRQKEYHTVRANKILDSEYKELRRIQNDKLSYYSNIDDMPF